MYTDLKKGHLFHVITTFFNIISLFPVTTLIKKYGEKNLC